MTKSKTLKGLCPTHGKVDATVTRRGGKLVARHCPCGLEATKPRKRKGATQ